jgi:hypothetical protein
VDRVQQIKELDRVQQDEGKWTEYSRMKGRGHGTAGLGK